MRCTRALLLIGSAAAVGGLLLPSFTGLAGVETTWIWGNLAEWEQWAIASTAALALAAAAGSARLRAVAAITAAAAAVAAALVGLAWSDAAATASELDGSVVRAGWGHAMAMAGLVLVAGAALRQAIQGRGSDVGPSGDEGQPSEPRFLDVVIEPPEG